MIDDPRRELLQRQLAIMWGFAESYVVDRIDRDLALWEPSANVCTVHRRDGSWDADWSDEKNGPLPDATIAWLLWHIEWWWADTIARVGGLPGVGPSDHGWSGGTAGIVAAKHAWDELLASTDLDALVDWHMPQPQPVWFVAAWVNTELTKNLAKINQLKVLYENRRQAPKV